MSDICRSYSTQYVVQDRKYGSLNLKCMCAAVQEERQRGKERGENEVESTSSFNEEMPVDKILDAELAVEPKTETYSDGSPSNSVRITATEPSCAPLITVLLCFFLNPETELRLCLLKMCCSVILV